MTAGGSRRWRIVRGLVTGALVLVGVVMALCLIVIPKVGGYETYVIVGRSMTGAIDIGSLVYSRPTPVADIKVGDIITFMPPGSERPVTHRIIAEKAPVDGCRVFTTQGDNVPTQDPWNLQIKSPMIPRHAFHIPLVGFALAVLSVRLVRVLLVVLPVMGVAWMTLVRLWRATGDELAAEDDRVDRDSAMRA